MEEEAKENERIKFFKEKNLIKELLLSLLVIITGVVCLYFKQLDTMMFLGVLLTTTGLLAFAAIVVFYFHQVNYQMNESYNSNSDYRD